MLTALLFLSSVGIGMSVMINTFMHAEPVKKSERIIQTVTVQTPPPPRPQIREKPPEPEIEEEKVKIVASEPLDQLPDKADEPPAAGMLGLDAVGEAGSDSFGLIGRKGGRGILAWAGDSRARFARQVQKLIEQALITDDEVRRHAYSVVLKVWIAFDGTIERTELVGTSG
jgi:periplasmic protein TonB